MWENEEAHQILMGFDHLRKFPLNPGK